MSEGEGARKSFYSEEVERLARDNEDFRRVLYTAQHTQIVLMAIPPGEEIGEETHDGTDQVLAFVAGEGEAVIEGKRSPVRAGSLCVVPSGTRHNFTAGAGSPLKLFTVYSPPEHPDCTVHRTKAEADEYEREHHH